MIHCKNLGIAYTNPSPHIPDPYECKGGLGICTPLPTKLVDLQGNPVPHCHEGCKGYVPSELPAPKMKGLGDVIAAGIKAVTFGLVTPCEGCEQRQQALNRLVPFGNQTTIDSSNGTSIKPLNWAYGVTTVRKRLNDGLLERTLNSLSTAGFDQPRLFVDGDSMGFERLEQRFEITRREQLIRPYGNWLLGIIELYVRNPLADRFAMFQDDFVTCLGLKQYLDATPYPENSYLNLYTFPHNQPDKLLQREQGGVKTHPKLSPDQTGFYPSCQFGKGAVALVFNLKALMTLLSQMHTFVRVQNRQIIRPGEWPRGDKAIDGAISESMKLAGFTEHVHNPSLVQHIGDESSMGSPKHLQAVSFKGENWDARSLLKK